MRFPKKWITSLAAVALSGILVWIVHDIWWYQPALGDQLTRSMVPAHRAESAALIQKKTYSTSVATSPSSTSTSQVRIHTPAPAPNTPLAHIYEDLRHAADEGDIPSQCRLGMELSRCADYLHRRDESELIYRAAQARPDSVAENAAIRDIEVRRAELRPLEDVCEGIGAEQVEGRWRYVLEAAKTGDIASILAFTINPPLDERNFTDDLESWQAYRENAGPLLEIAAKKGSLTGIYWLAWAYGGLPVAGGGPIVERDLVKAAAYALTARKFADSRSSRQIDRMLRRWEPELGPSGMALAQTIANSFETASIKPDRSRGDFVNNIVPPPEACSDER